MVRPPLPATLAGLLLAIGCAAAAGIVVYRFVSDKPRARSSMYAMAGAGLTFQVVHVLEHLLQLGFWTAAPDGSPWLSSWAGGTAEGLRYFCSLIPAAGSQTLGVEMLHLTGNTVFLGALTAWQIALRSDGRTIRALTTAERVQLFHVAEHVLLVSTLLVLGEARGLSTAFGTVDGAVLVALRVWFHFSINAMATGFALSAARSTLKGRWSQAGSPSPLGWAG